MVGVSNPRLSQGQHMIRDMLFPPHTPNGEALCLQDQPELYHAADQPFGPLPAVVESWRLFRLTAELILQFHSKPYKTIFFFIYLKADPANNKSFSHCQKRLQDRFFNTIWKNLSGCLLVTDLPFKYFLSSRQEPSTLRWRFLFICGPRLTRSRPVLLNSPEALSHSGSSGSPVASVLKGSPGPYATEIKQG